MNGDLPLTPAKGKNRCGLWLVGATAFLIPSLLPPFDVPYWWWVGGLLWQVGELVAATVFHLPTVHDPPALCGYILDSVGFPIALSITTILLWIRMVKHTGQPTAERGLGVFLLASILASISTLIVGTGVCLSLSLIDMVGAGCLWMGILSFTASQALFSFPFLLIAGACLGSLQGRSQGTA